MEHIKLFEEFSYEEKEKLMSYLVDRVTEPILYKEDYNLWEVIVLDYTYEEYKETREGEEIISQDKFDSLKSKFQGIPQEQGNFDYFIRNFTTSDGEEEHHAGEENKSVNQFMITYGQPEHIAAVMRALVQGVPIDFNPSWANVKK